MKYCLILCVLVGAIRGLDFSNPFAKNDETQCVAESLPKNVETCFENYSELGCFANGAPWRTFFRPFPKPQNPKKIDAKIYLFTRNQPDEKFAVKLWKDISINGLDFDPLRPRTVFITHGYSSNGDAPWLKQLKDAYLARRDANVFIVDWGKSANHWNYLQAAANTRVVGAELKRFVKYLIEAWLLDPARIHFLGHSLGAHISAYAAKGNPGVGHLTAFDPAQPGFEGCAHEVRLTKNDAKFVDVIHTNISPALPLLGFGLILPTGDVDYYFNGGALQPGCIVPPIEELSIAEIERFNEIPENINEIVPSVLAYVKLVTAWVACSHGKSYQYYIEALLHDDCTFWGRSTSIFGTLVDIATCGRAITVWENFQNCALDICSPIGLDAERFPARGSFAVSTREESPYCASNPKTTERMIELLREKSLEGNEDTPPKKKGPLDTLKDIFKPYL